MKPSNSARDFGPQVGVSCFFRVAPTPVRGKLPQSVSVTLGKSGLKVSKIILGCMSYGTFCKQAGSRLVAINYNAYVPAGSSGWQSWVLGEAEGIAHIKAAYDLGINTFDTANAYSNGLSEVILGKAIKDHNLPRDEIVVMTKVWATVARDDSYISLLSPAELDAMRYVNQRGLSRKHIFESVKHSLARLQLDYVDVLQCHRFDPETPIAETNHLNLVYREEEREMMPVLKHFGVASIPWSPLARGLLTRPLTTEASEETFKTKRGQADRMIGGYLRYPSDGQIVQRLTEMASKKDASMAQVALAWIMQKDGVAAPVVGTTSLENLRDLVEAVHLTLTKEEVRYLEEVYEPRGVFGHG
ncbi:hypothetical protein HWV62_9885 [Athelia sp. TMB]|nr:hypothetical protein HWV62_9885 [Athelia sp. TMB]